MSEIRVPHGLLGINQDRVGTAPGGHADPLARREREKELRSTSSSIGFAPNLSAALTNMLVPDGRDLTHSRAVLSGMETKQKKTPSINRKVLNPVQIVLIAAGLFIALFTRINYTIKVDFSGSGSSFIQIGNYPGKSGKQQYFDEDIKTGPYVDTINFSTMFFQPTSVIAELKGKGLVHIRVYRNGKLCDEQSSSGEGTITALARCGM